MKHLVAAAFILLLTMGKPFAQNAPFGLAWGNSIEVVRAAGISVESTKGTDFGASYIATNLPAALSDQEGAILSFGFDDKLWRIVAVSKEFKNDPYGSSVKVRYDELLEALKEKYGKATSFHRLGDSIYKEPQYFIAGVRSGKTSWFSSFYAPEVNAFIGIVASDSSDSRWRIEFENRDFKKKFEASKKAKEKGAL